MTNKRITLFSPLFLIAYICMFMFSCKKETEIPTPQQPNSLLAYQEKNVSYGNHPQQQMDIYLPAGRTKAHTATLILIHGGGWTNGYREEMHPFLDTAWAKENDIAIVNMSYRWATEYKHPAQVNDIGSVIDYLANHSDEYQLAPDRFALLGASAGGHLSMLYDYSYDTNNRVKAVINCVGPTDFIVPEILTDTAQYLSVYGLLGKFHWEDMPLWNSASPYRVCNSNSSPTYIMMGTDDQLVPTSQGIKLKARLDSLSVPAEYKEYEGAGHGWWSYSPYFDDTKLRIRTWLLNYL